MPRKHLPLPISPGATRITTLTRSQYRTLRRQARYQGHGAYLRGESLHAVPVAYYGTLWEYYWTEGWLRAQSLHSATE